jgi:hypothetical protein
LLIKNGFTFADFKKKCHLCTAFTKARKWKDGRVIDCTGLENRRTATYRGFESLSFRQQKTSDDESLVLINKKSKRENKFFLLLFLLIKTTSGISWMWFLLQAAPAAALGIER